MDCAEIGTIGAQRIGHVVSEVWEEGSAVRAHTAKLTKVAEQRRDAEKLKRQATANRKKAAAAVARAAAPSSGNNNGGGGGGVASGSPGRRGSDACMPPPKMVSILLQALRARVSSNL